MMEKFNQTTACAIVLVAGTLSAMGEDLPVTISPSVGSVQNIAHIYFNAVTGERVVTLLTDQVVGADTDNPESPLIWASLAPSACAAQGYSTTLFFPVSDPAFTKMGALDPLSSEITNLDYGDIAANTVVDCVEVNWVTAHPDNDLDGDGLGDGVEELAGQWKIWDNDNGRELNRSTRLPLLDVLFINLPGNILSPGELSGYTMDVDLVGFGTSTDLSFEICDSDGDCQSAAFCNNMVDYDLDSVPDGPIGSGDRDFDGNPDTDLDGDGLADWSWDVSFYQPGIGNDLIPIQIQVWLRQPHQT